MKVTVEINGSKHLIDVENIKVNDISLLAILQRLTQLEQRVSKYIIDQEKRDKKLAYTWEKVRGRKDE